MRNILLSILFLFPIIGFSQNYNNYLREMDDMCPYEFAEGQQFISIKQLNKTVTITFRFNDSQMIETIKRLDADKKTQDLVRDYYTYTFFEIFEGCPDFYSSFAIGVSKILFIFENSKSRVIHEIPIERNRYYGTCKSASTDGILPMVEVSKTNLKYFSLFENALGPYEMVPGYKRTKVNYFESNNRLEYICVIDEGKLGQRLPKSFSKKEKDGIKEMWFGPNSSFMDALYPTIKYLERLKGSFAVKIQGSISKNQIDIDLPYEELKLFMIDYRLNKLQ